MKPNLGRTLTQKTSRSAAAVLTLTLFATLTTALPALAQTETILYNFCSVGGNACTDGGGPDAGGPIMDSAGNVYGTTYVGGAIGDGTVYKLAPDGTETVLYSFGQTGNDGRGPFSPVIMDSKGNLYGTTSEGGEGGAGTVFKITPAGREKVLYSFCGAPSCTDGNLPYGGVILDKQGNLYGTTYYGGANKMGTVFKLTPGGTETVLHSFGSGNDGSYPEVGLIMDAQGNLYGVASKGGDLNFCQGAGCGAVFEVSPSGTETVLYSFCSSAAAVCADGQYPRGQLLRDKQGNLYGTTYNGGKDGVGTVFRLSPGGTETIIHSFVNATTDGQYPNGGVVMDSQRNLYGVTNQGGTYSQYGAVYEINDKGKETLLHSFDDNGVDGTYPQGNLLMDSSGNLYGTTSTGGTGSNSEFNGVLYKITP